MGNCVRCDVVQTIVQTDAEEEESVEAASESSADHHGGSSSDVFAGLPPAVVQSDIAPFVGVASLLCFRRSSKAFHALFGVAFFQQQLARFLAALDALLGAILIVTIPQLPLLSSSQPVIIQLVRRIFFFEGCGDWTRWKAPLTILYLHRRKPLVLGEGSFAVVSSNKEAFVGQPEAMRQWRVLAARLEVDKRTFAQWVDGSASTSIFNYTKGGRYQQYSLLDAASPLFPDDYDADNPPVSVPEHADLPSLTSLVTEMLLSVKDSMHHAVKTCRSTRAGSSLRQRCLSLLADGASSPTVCRVRLRSPNLSYRLFLLTDKTTSPFLAYFHVLREEAADSVSVSLGVFCDEGAPHDGTHELFVRCVGAEMGMRVWEEIDE
ncbi:unnamed protein product [Vitrella brassicaformis CCMP3155]|uniref:Uncharacterized protein n=1 Tax=Vitrella brassicaformis (strain CCMP3155) TaxID=1169540 RepID=A0A0G4EQB7_VITBC|nr:unnamed protein product [Vitrella brassicaformis CCMP3155]|eukprot:CEL99819.1 unnamed protein product [Vitrella brassicaformis CCMP3155]